MHQQAGRDQITEAVLADVRQAFADIQAQGHAYPVTGSPLAIWYVPSDGNAGSLAEIVHGCLTADGFQVNAVTAVPRQTVGDAWAFPASLGDVSRPLGVLIIHWWAITGSTLLHLVRLAAKSGASWIAAVCVLNQMDDANDAEVLRMLRVVSVPRGGGRCRRCTAGRHFLAGCAGAGIDPLRRRQQDHGVQPARLPHVRDA